MKTKNNKTNRKDKQWLRNPDQRKNKKLFNVQMIQLKDGSFHILGGGAMVEVGINQHSSEWVNVDVRDLAIEMRMNGVRSF